ncbi:MAG: transglycosylase domain-containing protein, partial [Hoeflea sp.]
MQDPFNQENRPRKRSNILLRIDSWIDSSMWNAGFRAGEIWEEITIFFRRFRTRGVWKAVFEIAGEGMNAGTAGLVLLLALALPAFEETSGNWRTRDDFAVTFLDRYGNEIGRRGVIHEDSVPVDQLPDHFVKAVLATEDRRFFEHFGIDLLGLARAMTENVKANSVVQGGS